MAHFDGDKPVTFAQARRGEVIVTQGYGHRPLIWRPSSGTFREAGLDEPTVAPTCTLDATDSYYVARVDILDGGGGFSLPPLVSFNGTSEKPAAAIARIRQGFISEVEVTQHGRKYATAPSVVLNGTGKVGSGVAATPNFSAKDPNTGKYYIDSVTIVSPGSGYVVPPRLGVWSDSSKLKPLGFCNSEIDDAGKVVRILPPSRATGPHYPDTSVIAEATSSTGTNTGGAKLQAIMRATLRGVYQCYYRFVDDSVPESEGGPLYTNLSPVAEVDAGNSATSITWSVPTPPAGLAVELWRTSSNQATTLYRVAKIGGKDPFGSTTDDINDNELTDPNRNGFLAMPILLPNGELNANRFGVPPDDYAVAVMFQDRLWMGVDTTGTRPNYLRFSEIDEPESMPDVNELIVQQNLRAADYVTALIPYAGALVVCQSRHSHRLTYVSQPLIDVGIFMLSYRGCLNQRCWDIYEGRAYLMDDQGVYSLDPQGAVEALSVGIDDVFQDKIDWSKRQWFIVRADRRLNVLRCSVAYRGDEGKYPTRQLVYSLDYKAWWEERHPATLVGATDCRTKHGNVALLWGDTRGNMYRLGRGLTDDANGAISGVVITNSGRGYRKPPRITATGGSGAEFGCAIDSNGQITGIQVRHCGTGYPGGSLVIDAPGVGGEQAAASYTVASGLMPVHYTFRSSNLEFATDTQNPQAGTAQNRQVSVVYQPTKSSTTLNLETWYNGADYPRSNAVRRDRGTGFVHSDTVPAATLDMQATSQQQAESHGVARALFQGRTLDDMMGTDRHVAIGLSGKQDDAGKVIVHSLDIHGVNQQG